MSSLPPRRRILAVLALLLVPLAVVGLFVGALSGIGSAGSRVPAAIVNEDQMVQQTAADGSVTPVLAGRLLVTELTAPTPAAGAASAFDWRITSRSEAADALARGDVYAVLTIPSGFSASIVSLSTPDPSRGGISIRTDDAHGYLAGSLTGAVGGGLASLFGSRISQQFIAGLVGGAEKFRSALLEASGGAAKLETSASGLGTALGALRDAANATRQGAADLGSGMGGYTAAVSGLSSGLGQLSTSTGALQALPQGVQSYTDQVSSTSGALAGVLASPQAAAMDPTVRARLQGISDGLAALSAAGPDLVTGARGAADAQTSIGRLAAAAAQVDAGSGSLMGATGSLAAGLTQLASGLDSSASGAGSLAGGAGTLSQGLTAGADKVPTYTADQAKHIAAVASSPIELTTQRSHPVGDVRSVASALLVPVGLWIGAFTVFLALGLLTRQILASSASSSRVTGYALTRGGAIVLAQAVLLVVLLHTSVGVPWAAFPATLPFSLLIAATFTCIHALLVAAFGRWGFVGSLMLLALQLTATGGLYPIQLVPEPFRLISPLLPLTQAVNGMQSIVVGVGAGPVIAAAVPLALWALVTAGLTVFAVSRRRSARALGLAPAPARAPVQAALPA